MPFEFKLPDLGEGVHEGEIARWLVAEGDTVSENQSLVEVMTDKVTAELPSPVAGTVVRLHGSPGEVVRVGTVLVEILTEDEVPSGIQAQPVSVNGEVEAAPAVLEGPEVTRQAALRPLAVPAVRRLARELGVDLASLAGSGAGGRILEQDVRAAAQGPAAPAPVALWPERRAGVRRIPLRGVRRAIAEHLLEAHRSTAPYTYVEEVDFTELVRFRERVQPLAQKAGVKLTYLPFLIAAVSMALEDHPTLNATVDPESGDLLVSEAHHIGVAVHTDEGLLVPVIRNVQDAQLLDLAREIERLSEGARTGRLPREGMTGGTFTLTSLGALGGLLGTPMLNTPQVAILGVHKIAPRAVVRDGAVVPRQTANLSLTLDHRYIDGHEGASFIRTLAKLLEDPAVMLFSLAELRESG